MKSINLSTLVLFLFIGFFAFESCKKNDDSFTPIKVEGVREKLVGRWEAVHVDAVGQVNSSINATGKSRGAPEGYYLLNDDSTYEYDLKAELEMKAGPLEIPYDYNDKDAGKWHVSDDEKSVIFVGNQGITQQLYFTQYDSLKTLYMEVAIPIDTSLNNWKYKGTIFMEMKKTS